MVSVCPPERLKRLVRSLDLQRVSVSHVRRDPLKLRELRHVDMAKFKVGRSRGARLGRREGVQGAVLAGGCVGACCTSHSCDW
jgi:hypothetical protein